MTQLFGRLSSEGPLREVINPILAWLCVHAKSPVPFDISESALSSPWVLLSKSLHPEPRILRQPRGSEAVGCDLEFRAAGGKGKQISAEASSPAHVSKP